MFFVICVLVLYASFSSFRTPERLLIIPWKYVNAAQFFQDAKIYLILFFFSCFLVFLGLLSLSYLATGQIKFIVFRAYTQSNRRTARYLRRRRTTLYTWLLIWGRVEGLVPPGGGLKYKFFSPTQESLVADDKKWRATVEKTLQNVKLVIVEVTQLTTSVLWEIETSLRYVGANQILVLDCRQSRNEQIHDKEKEFMIVSTPHKLSSWGTNEFLSLVLDCVRSTVGKAPKQRVLMFGVGFTSVTIGGLSIVVFFAHPYSHVGKKFKRVDYELFTCF